jgi:hypothetical protein
MMSLDGGQVIFSCDLAYMHCSLSLAQIYSLNFQTPTSHLAFGRPIFGFSSGLALKKVSLRFFLSSVQ